MNAFNWKYNIDIKKLLSEVTTPEKIEKLCAGIIFELERVEKLLPNSTIILPDRDEVTDDLEQVKGNFEFLKDLASGKITESEWDEYGFDGNFEAWTNGYMNDLYDLGDRRVMTISYPSTRTLEKFIWIS